jgi:hypothetical protein
VQSVTTVNFAFLLLPLVVPATCADTSEHARGGLLLLPLVLSLIYILMVMITLDVFSTMLMLLCQSFVV